MIQKNLFFMFLAIILLSVCCKEAIRKEVSYIPPDKSYSEVFTVINDSIKDGPYRRYYGNGGVEVSCTFRLGMLHGIERTYREDGSMAKMETYIDGKAHGEFLQFYPSDTVKLRQTYVNDVCHGISYGYYESGVLKDKVIIEHGFENGEFEEYYASGNLHWKGTFIHGANEQDSLYEYNNKGQLVKVLYCQFGFCNTVRQYSY